MIQFDQIGRPLALSKIPERIVCLVPSLTETLVDIGLENNIVGITKFCVHPPHLRSKTNIIGGTKNPKIQNILDLAPDLIIANKEENRLEDIDALEKYCPVYVSDIQNVTDTIDFIKDMSSIFENVAVQHVLNALEALHSISHDRNLRTCYLIWKSPWMTVGNDTFISHMMEKFGYQNVFDHLGRYPEISIEDIQNQNPDIIFLSSEPYPFKASDVQELSSIIAAKIILVDGEIFSWYGTRLLQAKSYFLELEKQTKK